MIGQYALSVTSISFSFLSMGYAVWCVAICQQDDTDNSCLPNKRANMAVAVVNIILGMLLGIQCILGSCFFCCYGRAMGFKSRRERFMRMQLQLMQAQMAATQQAQNYAPPPYPGNEQPPMGQPPPYSNSTYNTDFSTKY